MDVKQKILRFLIENKERSFSINEISRNLKMDYKLIYTNTLKLGRGDIINIEDLGNMKRCSFKNKTDIFHEDIFIVENQRKKDLFKNKDFLAIYNRIKKINQQFILILFGSYAKEKETKYSDIDLLLISDKEGSKIIENELELIPLKIHLTSVSYKDFIDMLKSREQSVVTEAIKKNIILFGLEDYYRLISNV
ncbi:MAG: nucleotidyltransferase domain-containing protein [Nanoarchaeota archaeon]